MTLAIANLPKQPCFESEELKQRILESSKDCIKVLTLDGRLLYLNTGGLHLLEIDDPASFLNAEWVSFWQGEDQEKAKAALAAAASGNIGQFQGYCPTTKGKPKWWDVIVTPIRDASGQVAQLLSISRDMTLQKQAEDILRSSEEQFRNMVDNAPVMVRVTDLTAHCTYLSQSWYDFTGQTEETGLGLGWLDTVHPENYEYAKKTFLEANSHCEAFRLEYRLRCKNGEYRFCIDAASPWFGVDGQFKGYIGSVINITERKEAEAERERVLQCEQAARAVSEAARSAAEQANRIKDEFLAVLSHELRSPLNPILGWASLLRHGRLDAAKTTYAVETIERNAKLQVQLIEDLLDISRILRGKLSLNVMPVDLGAAIGAALETVRLAAVAKSLQIQTTIAPTVGTVSGDAGRLQQVLWNLLSNAVKFTHTGGEITVALTQAGTHAQIQVRDTGKGINPNFLPYIFEHFRQEDAATTRKFGGLGLGLAIVRQIVELHGGTVQAESPGVGQGATFTVKLPLSQSREDSPISPSPHLPISPSPLLGIDVLVVDDEVDTRELIAFVLKQAGAIVTSVPSALAALEVITQSKPDVLVSDIGMAEMDGYMLMQQIRAMSPSKQIPAIALTAYAGESDRSLALRAGFQQHVSKPIEPEMLVQMIVSLIAKGSTADTIRDY